MNASDGGTAGDVEVHRHDLVDTLHHAVHIIHPARVGAAPHGDDPPGLCHLLVEMEEGGGYLLKTVPATTIRSASLGVARNTSAPNLARHSGW